MMSQCWQFSRVSTHICHISRNSSSVAASFFPGVSKPLNADGGDLINSMIEKVRWTLWRDGHYGEMDLMERWTLWRDGPYGEMEYRWSVYGVSMEYQWSIDGVSMECH